jgi:hypothetical protein
MTFQLISIVGMSILAPLFLWLILQSNRAARDFKEDGSRLFLKDHDRTHQRQPIQPPSMIIHYILFSLILVVLAVMLHLWL